MKTKRIIPCLDICKGKVVKGINFIGLREVGDPLEYAVQYASQGADEIVFLDIAATKEGKEDSLNLIREASKRISIPIIAGGGISSVEDIGLFLQAGASKVSINSAAVKDPELIQQAAVNYGSERIILAIDAKKTNCAKYKVMINGGKIDSGMNLTQWIKDGERLGAGEVLLTSMNADGVKEGFDLDMLNIACSTVKIPIIASGGCGTIGHFVKVFKETSCDAALAASIFHYGDLSVSTVKKSLQNCGINVKYDGEGACA